MKYKIYYKYKYYKDSPKATKYSDLAGRLFTWPCYLAYVVLFYGLLSRLFLVNFLNTNVILSKIALTVAFVCLLRQLKKFIDKKIDEFAEKEKNNTRK